MSLEAFNDSQIERKIQEIKGILGVIESSLAQIRSSEGEAHVQAAHAISQMALELMKSSVELEQRQFFRKKMCETA